MRREKKKKKKKKKREMTWKIKKKKKKRIREEMGRKRNGWPAKLFGSGKDVTRISPPAVVFNYCYYYYY